MQAVKLHVGLYMAKLVLMNPSTTHMRFLPANSVI